MSGTFVTHLTNYVGCDSLVTLNLTVKQTSNKAVIAFICQGSSYTVGTLIYNTTGVFVTHLTNYVGCDSSVTLNLTVNPLPNKPTFSFINCNLICDSICTSYQWYLGGILINGGTYQGLTVTQSGYYTIQITDVNGCTNTSAPVYVNCSTGINEPLTESNMHIFPNPASDHLVINYGNYATMSGYSVKITNSLAQLVYSSVITQQQVSINLSNWSGKGTYILSILNGSGAVIETRKIVLQ
jgi:hypothetical protein